MNKVLIVTYYFPPRPAVASLRPYGLATYLPEYGWEVAILTAALPAKPSSDFQIIETRHVDRLIRLKRLLGIDTEQNLMTQVAQLKKKLHIASEKSLLDSLLAAFGEVTAYPDAQKGWRPFATAAGTDFLQRDSVDAILSTSAPVTTHIVAGRLKRTHAIPWIADLQDLWTQNHFYPYSRLRRTIERRLEHRTLREADSLVTVSEPIASRLRALHAGKTVFAIPNGFDPADVNSPPAEVATKFTITYTGNLYPGKQRPEILFAALRELLDQGVIHAERVDVRFFGAEAGWLDKQAERNGVKELVRQYGLVPRETALRKQRESQVLLLLKWQDPQERGVYSAKLFEYLASRRPILAIGGFDDVVNELLDETEAGSYGSTKEEVKRAVADLYGEYLAKGKVEFRGLDEQITRYSQREMAREFARVLEKVTGGSAPSRNQDVSAKTGHLQHWN